MVVIKVDTAVDTRAVVAVEKKVVITVVLIMVTDVIAGDTCLEDIIRKTYFSYGNDYYIIILFKICDLLKDDTIHQLIIYGKDYGV
jgi:hypothetical protein